jgi:hypothetical protein
VRLKRILPDVPVPQGTTGAVVYVYPADPAGYEVDIGFDRGRSPRIRAVPSLKTLAIKSYCLLPPTVSVPFAISHFLPPCGKQSAGPAESTLLVPIVDDCGALPDFFVTLMTNPAV